MAQPSASPRSFSGCLAARLLPDWPYRNAEEWLAAVAGRRRSRLSAGSAGPERSVVRVERPVEVHPDDPRVAEDGRHERQEQQAGREEPPLQRPTGREPAD